MKLIQCFSALLLALILGASTAFAEIVTGTVEDDSGEPLIGASVKLKGNAAKAVVTDIDGNFRLDVPNLKTAVLVVSYVGYDPQEMKVNGRKNVNIVMTTNNNQLEDLVVVGYGQQKKASVVGAITQTSGEVLERSAGVHDITQAITGNLPGVVTVVTSGMPGDESARISIRGASTWNSSEPLVLVDGIERDMSSVDASSVQTISVLKDASATAVYGVRGANGVILITTKRGEEGRARIDVGFTATLKQASKLPNKMDSYDALAARNVAVMHELGLQPESWAYMTPVDILNKYRNPANLEEMERYPNIDWQDYLFTRHAMSYNGNVSVSGGTNFVKYFAVLDYVHEGDLFHHFQNNRGYETGFGFNRINVRSNLDFKLTKTTNFKIGLSGSNGQQTATQSNSGGGFDQANWNDAQVWNGAYNIAPNVYMPIYADGSVGYYPKFASQTGNCVSQLMFGGIAKLTNTRINTDFVLEQDLSFITKGLNLRGMIAWDNLFQEQNRGVSDLWNNPQQKWIDPETGDVTFKESSDASSKFDYNTKKDWSTTGGSVNWTTRNLNYQVQLNWNRQFGEHGVGATGVWTRSESAWGSMIPVYREDWVFRATYNFADKYFVEYNGAYNGSEKFGKGWRFGFFNSGAVGWRISQEKFWEPLRNYINDLKVRASYGEIGDDSGAPRFNYIDEWAFGGKVSLDMNNFAGWGSSNPYEIYRLAKFGNPDTHWEKVKKYNLGIDYAFFNNLLAGTIELFKDKRSDILISGEAQAFPSFFGPTPPTRNLGKAESKGYEVEIRFNKSLNRDLRLWANCNFTHAENKIIFADDPVAKPAYQKQEGYAIAQNKSYIDRGFLNTWDEVYGSPAHDVNDSQRLPGDYYIIDFNGDGIVDVKDRVPYGYNGTPQNTYSATLGADWKGFSFFVQFYGVTNVTRLVQLASFANYLDNVYDIGTWWSGDTGTGDMLLPRWQTQNDANGANHASTPYGLGTQYMYDGSYVRLKNIEIAYTFNQSWVKKLGLGSLRVFLNGNNLWVWSRMPDDREGNFGSYTNETNGSGTGAYPTMRRFNLGIKFNL